MVDTGVVRRVDDLGRIVIPMELRRSLGIQIKDPLSISVDNGRVVLQKYAEACVICGSENLRDAKEVNGKFICTTCQTQITG